MLRRIVVFVLIPLVVTAACRRRDSVDESRAVADASASISDEVQAAATVRAMLALAEDGEWDAYVDDYYGEAHKFDSPSDRKALVDRFEQQWGTRVIDGLRQAASVTPMIDEEGRAVFSVNGQSVFVLYRAADGRWTFHL